MSGTVDNRHGMNEHEHGKRETIRYGGVEKFIEPMKHRFDGNPRPVSCVNFLRKPDQHATPWLAGPASLDSLSFYPEQDGLAHKGILIERDDNGHGALGDNPYAIRGQMHPRATTRPA